MVNTLTESNGFATATLEAITPAPTLRVRMHTNYQAGPKLILPDVTIELTMPIDGSVTDAVLNAERERARAAAIEEFQKSVKTTWAACQEINAEIGK